MSTRVFLSIHIIICWLIRPTDQSTKPRKQISDVAVIKWGEGRHFKWLNFVETKCQINEFKDQILNDPYLQGLNTYESLLRLLLPNFQHSNTHGYYMAWKKGKKGLNMWIVLATTTIFTSLKNKKFHSHSLNLMLHILI